jgi:hypothetical protein
MILTKPKAARSPAEGYELVIVELGHKTIMPLSWPSTGPPHT